MSNAAKFLKIVNNPLKFRIFLFFRLPSAWLAGVRVISADEDKCAVSVPFKWLSQNPFRSTYFACLSMAAEMSTGILGMAHVYERKPAISMLVLRVHGEYHKKATRRTVFTCEDGKLIRDAVEAAIATGEGRSVTARSYGRNPEGEIVAEFTVTWSFKVRATAS